MEELLARVRRYACRYNLFTSRETVIVGVSGGPDSLCLLHLLVRLAPEFELSLHVAHLNHGLRQAESDADAQYVAALADKWGLPCTVGQADIRSSLSRLSLEEAARHARYRFLAGVASAVQAATIAVGHHADDQAETVLMHFLRGSGVAGMRGMRPSTWLAEYRLDTGLATQIRLVRPLLSTPRQEIEAYCAEHGLEPRLDRSNEDLTFYRNRLRHELLPILQTYNPRIRKVLRHTAEIMAGDHDILRSSLNTAWRQVTLPDAPLGVARGQQARILPPVLAVPHGPGDEASRQVEDVQFDLNGWRALPLGLQRATIREAIHILRGGLRNINWEHVERAVWLAREGRTGQSATLTAGLALEIGYNSLRVAPATTGWPSSRGTGQGCPPIRLPRREASLGDAPHELLPDPRADGRGWIGGVPQVAQPVSLVAPGVTLLANGWRVYVRPLERAALTAEHPLGAILRGGRAQAPFPTMNPWVAWMDADKVGPHPGLRPRQPGDTFQPHGLSGRSTKLNEFMINQKVPRDARGGWPLLVGQMGLAWVCGLRLDERAIVRPDTENIWEVRFVRETAGQQGDQPTPGSTSCYGE